MHRWLCDDGSKMEASRGRYALRAGHDKPETACAARTTDFQLVKRCRARRRAQWHGGMRGRILLETAPDLGSTPSSSSSDGPINGVHGWPPPPVGQRERGVASIECPAPEARAAFAARRDEVKTSEGTPGVTTEDHVAMAVAKYTNRSSGGSSHGCESAEAEWKVDLATFHKCILVVVMERLQFPPGSLLLDWGAGCGHKLTWASQLYDIEGLGVDIVGDNVRWARRHSMGHFCEADGRFLSWLPDGFFDGVISYAALSHIHPLDQCAVVLDLIGKVRVGGKLWFGWNAPGIWVNASKETVAKMMLPADEAWSGCFSRAPKARPAWASGGVRIVWETIEENFLFPDSMDRVDTYLYWPPAYSLFITRIGGGPGAAASVW